ncbi:hypothetical protein TYRP_003491 [Tyrophagus putrescentiae]|nr:hypothetical protein TYRP_003491 [Tyrophagus putrescentiae]
MTPEQQVLTTVEKLTEAPGAQTKQIKYHLTLCHLPGLFIHQMLLENQSPHRLMPLCPKT